MTWNFQSTVNVSDAGGVWRTTKDGSRIFIKDGEAYAGGPKGPNLNEPASAPKKSSKKGDRRPSIQQMAAKSLQSIVDDNEFFGFEDFLDEEDLSLKDMTQEDMNDLARRMDALVAERKKIFEGKKVTQKEMREVWPAIVKAEREIKDWRTIYRIDS